MRRFVLLDRGLGSFVLGGAAVGLAATSVGAQSNYGYFGRATDTASVNANTIAGTAMTIEARFQIPTSLDAFGGDIFHEQYAGQEDKSLNVSVGGLFGNAWARYVNGHDDPGISATIAVTPGAWHQAAFVRDGSVQRIYLDGTLAATRDLSTTPYNTPIGNSASSPMALGAFQFAPGSTTQTPAFRGLLDWVRVSNTARYTSSSYTLPTAEPAPDAATQLLMDFNVPTGSTSIAERSGTGAIGRFGVGFSGATLPLVVQPGDTNFDGVVNFTDLLTLAQHYGSTSAEWETGDFTGDRVVGFGDLLLLAQHYGHTGGAGLSAVPDPMCGASLVVFAIGIAARRRRA
jgi:hypothetical protein